MLTLRPVFSMLMNFPSAAQSLMEIGPLALLWKLVFPGRTSPFTMKLGTGGGDGSGSTPASAVKQNKGRLEEHRKERQLKTSLVFNIQLHNYEN